MHCGGCGHVLHHLQAQHTGVSSWGSTTQDSSALDNPKNARYTLWPTNFDRHHTKRGEVAISKYCELAKKYNIPASTFANAYVNDRPFVTSNIIGATNMDQLKENIDSIDITLSKEALSDIEDIHLSDPNPCV